MNFLNAKLSRSVVETSFLMDLHNKDNFTYGARLKKCKNLLMRKSLNRFVLRTEDLQQLLINRTEYGHLILKVILFCLSFQNL